MGEQRPAEEYDGPAVVSRLTSRLASSHLSTSAGARTSTPGGAEDTDGLEVRVTLRGHFEPLDGRFHWYGRIGADDELAARYPSGSRIVLTTPHGRAEGRLSDVDPWGRFRVSGTGRPPY